MDGLCIHYRCTSILFWSSTSITTSELMINYYATCNDHYCPQSPETKVLLVQQQPVAPNTSLLTERRPVGDHCLIFSIVMSVVAVFCFCVTIPALLCTIPALILSILVRNHLQNYVKFRLLTIQAILSLFS